MPDPISMLMNCQASFRLRGLLERMEQRIKGVWGIQLLVQTTLCLSSSLILLKIDFFKFTNEPTDA